jgi:hypothetical protein
LKKKKQEDFSKAPSSSIEPKQRGNEFQNPTNCYSDSNSLQNGDK